MSQIFKDKNGMEFKFEKYGMFGQANSDYPAASGVYIMAKGDTPLYIGESEDLKKWLKPGHEKSECPIKAGADCIYICLFPKEENEKRVGDLIYAYNPPCNGRGK